MFIIEVLQCVIVKSNEGQGCFSAAWIVVVWMLVAAIP